jgi:hypothetical protein
MRRTAPWTKATTEPPSPVQPMLMPLSRTITARGIAKASIQAARIVATKLQGLQLAVRISCWIKTRLKQQRRQAIDLAALIGCGARCIQGRSSMHLTKFV